MKGPSAASAPIGRVAGGAAEGAEAAELEWVGSAEPVEVPAGGVAEVIRAV
jgi:hypothetical protein